MIDNKITLIVKDIKDMNIIKLSNKQKYELQIAVDLWLYNGIIKDGFTLDEQGEIWFSYDYES